MTDFATESKIADLTVALANAIAEREAQVSLRLTAEGQLREAQQEIRRLQTKRDPFISGMRLVYIAHRLSAPTPEGMEANRQRASRWCAWAAKQGVSPVATWIVLSSQWPETPENRALGIDCDLAAIERCDELWLCGAFEDYESSAGMRAEQDHAVNSGVHVVTIFTADGEPPALPADGGRQFIVDGGTGG